VSQTAFGPAFVVTVWTRRTVPDRSLLLTVVLLGLSDSVSVVTGLGERVPTSLEIRAHIGCIAVQ
jgi:hypothetical protein